MLQESTNRTKGLNAHILKLKSPTQISPRNSRLIYIHSFITSISRYIRHLQLVSRTKSHFPFSQYIPNTSSDFHLRKCHHPLVVTFTPLRIVLQQILVSPFKFNPMVRDYVPVSVLGFSFTVRKLILSPELM